MQGFVMNSASEAEKTARDLMKNEDAQKIAGAAAVGAVAAIVLPISMVTGAVIGIVQDAISGLPIGINGIADTIIGYIGSSVSLKLEVEQIGPRFLMIFGFKFLHDAVGFLIQSRIVGNDLAYKSRWELYSALANAVIGSLLFTQLDRLKKRR